MRVDKSKWNNALIKDSIKTLRVKDAIQKKDYLLTGKYPIISQEKDFISGYCNTKDNLNENFGEVVIFGDHTRIVKYVDFDFCIGADGVKVLRPINKLSSKYLYYFIKWSNIPSNGYSRHFKFLRDIRIQYPEDKSIQQKIAAELDSVQKMIDGYKAQLADLDTLAQSIFLDMFGDPVHNENSFPICTVGDIYEFRYGQGNNIPESKGNYPCYGSNGIVGYHIDFNSEDAPIIGHIGAYAGIVNWGKGKHFVTYNGVRCILKRNDINPIYGFFLLRNQNYRNQTRGGAQPFVSYDILEAPKTFIPPLPLQQQFTERVKSIERQKELICQQLTDAETLMAERMQYYFS